MKLTPKQELFCQEYIKTGNASEAYRLSYNTSKMKAEAINVNASKLLKNTKIRLRVNKLQEELSKQHDLTKDKILTRLKEIIFNQDLIHDEKIDLNAMNKAIDTVNKMQGFYAPEKIDANVTHKKGLDDYYDEV